MSFLGKIKVFRTKSGRRAPLFLAILILAAAAGGLSFIDFGGTNKALGQGGGDQDLCGWAWSENIGWLSFNSADQSAGGSYKVSVDNGGKLRGYGWSEHVGWVKFGELSSFPQDPGTEQVNAYIRPDDQTNPDYRNGTLRGWARVCAGTSSGDCNSMSSRTDGWDGWISLKGSTPDYGVSVNNGTFSGYSWGGDTGGVVGWLNWGIDNNFGGVRFCDSVPPVPQFDYILEIASPVNLSVGQQIQNYPVTVRNQSAVTERVEIIGVSDFNGNIATVGFNQNNNSCTPPGGSGSFCEIPLTITATGESSTAATVQTRSSSGVVKSQGFNIIVSAQAAAALSCRPNPRFAFVNKQIIWRATTGYDEYSWRENGAVVCPGSADSCPRTYDTPGRKTMTVTGSRGESQQSTADCDPSAVIVILPTFEHF